MTESSRPPGPSRREFLRLAAVAGIAGALTPPVAFAQSATPAPKPAPTPQPVTPAAPPAAPATPEGPSEAARALTAILQQRLGKERLSAEQWEAVAKDFDYDLSSGKRMAAVKLANADEPDYSFFAMPAPPAPRAAGPKRDAGTP